MLAAHSHVNSAKAIFGGIASLVKYNGLHNEQWFVLKALSEHSEMPLDHKSIQGPARFC